MTASAETLRRTPLYSIQRELGGRFVPFHGWELPLQFSGILKEHQAVRGACGLFDVSHMGQIEARGPGALALVQEINSNDASRLAPGRAMYSHMLNERGGVIDDVIVSRLAEDRFFFVVNAATREKDAEWIRARARGRDASVEDLSDRLGMLALQGPVAADVLETVDAAAASIERFGAVERRLYGQTVLVTRTGYTGEDGFELVAPSEVLPRLWQSLTAAGASFGLLPCGLGARDVLRLEAGYLLYGSDIDEEHTPLEAGYDWVVKPEKGPFIGREALQGQARLGLVRRLAGVRLTEGGVPRPGASVLAEGRPIGRLTSATFSPTLQAGIGLGYLEPAGLKPGTPVVVQMGERRFAAEIAALPFYRPRR